MKNSLYEKIFCRYINGTKGVISLFLAILMVPFISIAGALLNAARINSAVAIFDEALCNASNSTLGTYDAFLKKRFGLLAMAQSGSGGSSYTAQDFISETFQFYMEQNLGVLSNTYISAESSAAGVYPLADTDVLLSEVLEYSKYTIPTELVINGLSLDSLLSTLTGGMDRLENVVKMADSGVGLATSFDEAQENMDILYDKLVDCEGKRGDYNVSHSSFSTAVNNYNSKVDEMKVEVGKCEAEVTAAEAELSSARAELETSYDEETGYSAAAQARVSAAETALQEAKDKLQETIEKYHNELIPLRSAANTSKTDYASKIYALADAVEAAGEAISEAQESVIDVIEGGASFAGDVATTVYAERQHAISENTKTLEAYKKDAQKWGSDNDVYRWEKQIEENKKAEVNSKNQEKILTEATKKTSKAVSEIDEFAREQYKAWYTEYAANIRSLGRQVTSFSIPTEDERTGDIHSLYIEVNLPLSSQYVKELMENLGANVAESSLIAIVKALVGFIEALFKLKSRFDPDLNATVHNSSYSSIGGLPSRKDRSVYSLGSDFQAEDKAQSDHYKEVMGKYSSSGLNTSCVSDFQRTVHAVINDIKTISELKWDWKHVLSSLAKLVSTVISLAGHLLSLAFQMDKVIKNAVYERVLLAGYLGYNTANRTTYTGSALTGGKYNLADPGSASQKAFCGAETEYIIRGNMSEQQNQEDVFYIIYVIRAFCNVPVILLNAEVESIAASAGAATFGVGTFVTYILYTLAEPFIDTMILVNGGDIPIIKSVVYLTPSGVVPMINEFFHLTLNEAQKNEAYKEVVKVMQGIGRDEGFAENYADAVSAFGPGTGLTGDGDTDKIINSFSLNYTKMLILIMLFLNTEDMLNRLSDIIQMEAALDTESFNLDKSYTYLRASGSFSSNEFIRLSDADMLNSTERITYRGY